jgi:mannosyltransferase OCH1-like enzyme
VTISELRNRRFFQLSDFAEGFFDRVIDLPRWKLLADRFDAFQALSEQRTPRSIPHRIHQIWLGGALPSKYVRWTESWKSNHRSWEYRLWEEKAILRFGLVNERAFRSSPSFGAKSDIARYEILERLGGIYADTDFECLQPFDEIVECCSFVAATIFRDSPEINNGLMGCVPGHPLVKRLIMGLGKPIRTTNGMTVLRKSGPHYLTERFFESAESLDTEDVILPSSFFYPLPNFARMEGATEEDKKKYAREWSLAIHFWETSWLPPHPLRVILSKLKRKVLGRALGKVR